MKKINNIWKGIALVCIFSLFGIISLFTAAPSAEAITFGSEFTFNSAHTSFVSVATLDSTHFVAIYLSTSSEGKVIIGERSGNNISYGTAQTFNSVNTIYMEVSRLDSTHFVIVYKDEGDLDYGEAIIGEANLTTNSITLGSASAFNSAGTQFTSVAALDNNHFVATYQDQGNSNYGTSIVGTVSGTTITGYGTEAVFNPGGNGETKVKRLNDTHFVVIYVDGANSSYGTARIGEVNLSTGAIDYSGSSELVFHNYTVSSLSAATISYDGTDGKIAIAYAEGVGAGILSGRAIIGTISSEFSIAFGSSYVFNHNDTRYNSITKIDNYNVLISYQDYADSEKGKVIKGKISGDQITYGNKFVFQSTYAFHASIDRFSGLGEGKFVIGYRGPSPYYGKAVIGDYQKNYQLNKQVSTLISSSLGTIISVQNVNGILNLIYQSGGGFIERNNLITGINNVHQKINENSGLVNIGYSISTSPNQIHLLRYNYETPATIFDNTVHSDAHYHLALDEGTINSVTDTVVVYARKSDGLLHIYYNNGASWVSESLGKTAADVPIAARMDAGGDVVHLAYYDGSNIKAFARNVHTDTDVYEVSVASLADAPLDIIDTGFNNSRLKFLYENDSYQAVSSYYDGASYQTANTITASADNWEIHAIEDPNNASQTLILNNDGSDLKMYTYNINGTLIDTDTVVAGVDYSISPTFAGVDDSNYAIMTVGQEGGASDDSLQKISQTGSGFDPPEQMNQEEGGPTIPELPKNSLWKILIALLALGGVIGVAAFWRNKKA